MRDHLINTEAIKAFQRSDDYQTKIFLDALDRHVVLDAIVEIRRDATIWDKLKAWCPNTNTNLQFPTRLRDHVGQVFVADVIKAKRSSGKIFYRAYPKSIRNAKTGEVVA